MSLPTGISMQDPPRSAAKTASPRRQRAPTPGGDVKRERILRVAERLFHEQGYADTTMDQIVSELGVTKPFVYYYFRNKLEIFELLAWEPTVAVFTVLDDPDDRRPAHEKVAGALEAIIRITVEFYPSAFFAFREPQVFSPKFAAATKKLANQFYDKLCAQMELARAQGTLEFGSTKVTALAACSISGYMYTWYRPDGNLPPERIVPELAQLAWRVIGLKRKRISSNKKRV
jgi:AcrR family transcriptional regulator